MDYRQEWSPDGTLIAYLSQVADLSVDLRVVDAHGQNQLTLADHLAEAGNLVWSPDSRQVAYDARVVGLQSYQL